MSNTPDLLLNESQGTPSWICKLRERIHLDPVSGSLTITDLSLNDTRLYCGQVWKKTGSFHRFNVTILDPQPGADWNIDSPIPWVIGVVLFLCLCLLGVLATYFLFKQKRNIGVVNNQEGTRQVRGSGGTSGDQPEQPGMPLLDKVVVGGEKQTGEPILPPADAEERSTESPIQVAGEGEGQTTQ